LQLSKKLTKKKREAERKARQEDIQKKTDANQAMADARPKEMTEEIKEDMKNDRNETTACQEAMKANPKKLEPIDSMMVILEKMIATMNANQEKMEVMDLKGNLAEMECESEHQETLKEDAVVEPVKGRKKWHRCRKLAAKNTKVYQETTACHKAMKADMEKIEPDPEMMQSAEEHQEIPIEDAAIMPVGEPRKRRRVQYLATQSHWLRKDRTRGNHGSRRTSPAACRKVYRRAKVAWRNRNIVRNNWTQKHCGALNELNAARMRTSRCADVPRGKGNVGKTRTRNNAVRGTSKQWTYRRRQRASQPCNSGMWKRDPKEL
jgi:hypothetical protein